MGSSANLSRPANPVRCSRTGAAARARANSRRLATISHVPAQPPDCRGERSVSCSACPDSDYTVDSADASQQILDFACVADGVSTQVVVEVDEHTPALVVPLDDPVRPPAAARRRCTNPRTSSLETVRACGHTRDRWSPAGRMSVPARSSPHTRRCAVRESRRRPDRPRTDDAAPSPSESSPACSQKVFEPRVVTLHLGMQLHQQRLATLAERRPASLEPLDPRLGRPQPPVVGQPALRLDRHREAVGQPLSPPRERLVLGPAVEARVELDGVELLDIARQSLGRR